jgi:hypothetical protein
MGINNFLTLIFGNYAEKELKRILPIVDRIAAAVR